MDCSFDESSELSDTDIDDYAEKVYMDLKSGKLVARLGLDVCSTPGRRSRITVTMSCFSMPLGGCIQPRCQCEGKPPGLANLLQTDHADVAGSLIVRQAEALFDPPKPVQDQELFVYPWMGILANVPVEQTEKGGATLMQ
jgi:hypothetical protein